MSGTEKRGGKKDERRRRGKEGVKEGRKGERKGSGEKRRKKEEGEGEKKRKKEGQGGRSREKRGSDKSQRKTGRYLVRDSKRHDLEAGVGQ